MLYAAVDFLRQNGALKGVSLPEAFFAHSSSSQQQQQPQQQQQSYGGDSMLGKRHAASSLEPAGIKRPAMNAPQYHS